MLIAVAFLISRMGGGTGTASSRPTAVITARGASEQVGEQQLPAQGIHIPVGQKGVWTTDPPTSGQHYSGAGVAPVPWGTADQQLTPELWVHNLEHGGVAILYNCPSGCSADTAAIRSFVALAPQESEFHEVKLVASPYAVPGHRFALVAWGWRLFLDSWDPVQAEQFYAAHVDRAPEDVP
jgi:Protein of unknown function (DUF3105)